MIKFNRTAFAATEAGKIVQEQQPLTRKEKFRERLANDPNMIKRGYEHGWIQLGERVLFVRSRWDGNICAYLEYLKQTGKIKRWAYENKTFWFKGVKRGTNNYKPDLWIEENDGREVYIEVKAYWTDKDTVKMKRMKKYFPDVKIFVLADDKCFKRMAEKWPDLQITKYASYDAIKQVSHMIPGWNQRFMKREEIQHLIPIVDKAPKNKKNE